MGLKDELNRLSEQHSPRVKPLSDIERRAKEIRRPRLALGLVVSAIAIMGATWVVSQVNWSNFSTQQSPPIQPGAADESIPSTASPTLSPSPCEQVKGACQAMNDSGDERLGASADEWLSQLLKRAELQHEADGGLGFSVEGGQFSIWLMRPTEPDPSAEAAKYDMQPYARHESVTIYGSPFDKGSPVANFYFRAGDVDINIEANFNGTGLQRPEDLRPTLERIIDKAEQNPYEAA